MRSFSKRGRWSSLGVSTLALAALSVACSDSGESGDFAENSGGGDKPPSAPSNAAGDAPSQGLHSIPEGRADDPVRFNSGPPLDVHLRSRTWTPQPGVDAATKVALGRARDAGKSYLRVYAQRASIPTLDEWSKIEKKDIGVESYVGDLTWVLRLPVPDSTDATLSEAARDFASVALTAVLPSDKTDAETLAGKYPAWAFDAQKNRLALNVLLYAELAEGEREEFLITAGGGGAVPEDRGDHSYRIEIDPANLNSLLELGAVRFVEPADPAPQVLMAGGLATTNADRVQGLVDIGSVAEYAGYTGRGIRMSNSWEGVDKNHDDFWNHDASGARTTGRFSATNCSAGDHGIMTAGLMLGNGFRSTSAGGAPYQYRGMAPEATFVCQNDPQDISSHSYVTTLGPYSASQATIDRNIRGDNSAQAFHPAVGAAANQGINMQYGAQVGYYSVYRTAKNEITVGSIASPDLRWLETSIGPTFDGRLKPDIVAPAGATLMPDRLDNIAVDIDSITIERGTPLLTYTFDGPSNYIAGWGADGWWDRANVGNFQQIVESGTKAFRFTINPLPWGWAWAGWPMVGTSKAPDGVANLNVTGAATDVVKVRYRTANVPEWQGSPLTFNWSDKPGIEDRYYNVFSQAGTLESDGVWHTISYPVGTNPNWNGKANIQWIRLSFGGPRLPTPGASNSYQGASGSSAASPVVAGGVALLMEQFTDRYGVVMGTHTPSPLALTGANTGVPLASTFKAVLLHTARDLASVPRTSDPNNPDTGVPTAYHKGPDLVTGYGVVDVAEAVRLIDADANARTASQAPYLLENTLTTTAGDHFTINVAPNQKSPLKVTVAWDDAAGDPSTAEVVPKLVNNVDLLLKGPDGLYYLPYSLDQPYVASSPAQYPSVIEPEPITAASIRRARQDLPNNRDNVEQVYVENPLPGTWHVFVLPGGLALPPQNYSLVLGTPPELGALNQGKIVFMSERPSRQLYVKDLTTGTLTQLTSDAPEKGVPKISPDGRYVLATSGVDLKIYDINNGSTVATFLASSYGLAGFRYPSWSPDGTKITVDAIQNGTSNGLRVLEFPQAYAFSSATMRTLVANGTALNTYETEFSRDGSEILIVADEGGVNERLFRMPISGGTPRRFYVDGVQARHANWPSISPDGRRLLVNSRMYKDDPVGFPQGEEILEYGYHTGVSRRVTAENFDQLFATFARNGSGEFVMESKDASGRAQLYVQNDGVRTLVDIGDPSNLYHDGGPDWWKPRPNLARSSTPSASSTFNGYSVANIIDGNQTTAQLSNMSWTNVSGVLPQWVQLDFGANRTFSKVELFTSIGYELRDYDVEYLDGATWKKVAIVKGNTGTRRTHEFQPVTSRYLRVTCRLGPPNQPTYTRINELEVY